MKDKIADMLKFLGLQRREILALVEIPKNPGMGDYAFPCFTFAKKLRKSPSEIAKEVASKIKPDRNFSEVKAVGPYVNFLVNKEKLAGSVIDRILKEKEKYGSGNSGKGKKIMVEFSQPNTHKAFHVGHIRGTSLGESLARVMEFSGNRIVRANYSGDTGMHIAKWLWAYKKYHKKEKPCDDETWFARIYVNAVRNLEDNKKGEKEVEEINRKLENKKDKELNKLWEETRRLSISSWVKIYHELNTRFDVHYFESEVEKKGGNMVRSLLKRKIAEISDGASVVNLEKYGLGVFLLLRQDGTILYGGKDIALAEKKFKDYKPDKSIYVIGKEQDLYIHQVFKTLELMDSKLKNRLIYVPFNEIRFPWGKMSSRSGENVLYSDLKEQLKGLAEKEVKKRFPELKGAEIADRALAIAMAAIKYSILKQDASKNIVFNPKEIIRFEGDTGPYLLYSYARSQSILRKADYKTLKKFTIKDVSEHEKKLVSELARLPEVIGHSYDNLAPNSIANYAYELAKTFSEFYHNVKVIGSGESEQFRLKLVDAFGQTIRNALWLLGIPVIREM